MIGIAARSVRAHPAGFAGAFVSVALAAALLTVTTSAVVAVRRPEVVGSDSDLATLATTLLANATAVAVLAATFVTSSTLSYSALQRQRELALLRLAGASGARTGALLLVEAFVVGLIAAVGGALCGLPLAPLAARGLSDAGLAPAALETALPVWPAALSAGVALAVALAAAVPVALTSSRVPAAAALRDAGVPVVRTGAVRLVGVVLLAAGAVLEIALIGGADTPSATAYLVLLTLTLTALAALCGPVLARVILGATALLARGGPLLLALAAARTDLRRTVATVTPVLVTVALASGVLAGTSTIAGAGREGLTTADYVAVGSVIGLALVYTAISVAVVFAMSTERRRRELAALRLAGAARADVLRVVAADVVLVLLVAVVQAAVVTVVVVLTAAGHASAHGADPGRPDWWPVLAVAGACAVLAAGSALPVARWATGGAAVRQPQGP
ncbi:FtsX-like permease family protein [Promicromonospora sp. NPDC050880]|uniref:FtsX-like permease family protein n=1 Tax=Promicromonospora sp. NPDC050880 TaxID=3364406 RepID=UPI0037B8D571